MNQSVVAALRACADLLDQMSRRLSICDVGASAFGASGPGRLGDLGRDLYLQWQRALDARVHEAAAHAARVHALADATARASIGYAEADDSARRKHPEVP